MSLKITNLYNDINEVISFIENYINNQKLASYEIDISSLNAFDALKISVFISTKYFNKENYKYKWIVNNGIAYNLISKLKLSNMSISIDQSVVSNKVPFFKSKYISI